MRFGRRMLCGILALVLWCSFSFSAWAEEPEESTLASGVENTPETEEGEGISLENQEQSLAVDSLLVTGGHETYMYGYTGALFKPENTMTRAEAAQMLYNLLAARPAVSESQFSDVSLTSWYGTAVNTLAKSDVLHGYKDGTFKPNAIITRAEFVTALCKCFTVSDGEASFEDVPETSWYYPFVAKAVSAGWVHGVTADKFEPDRGIKRCEAVTVMNLALGRKDEGFAADRDTQKFKDVPKTHWAYLQITEAAQPVAESDPVDTEFEVGQTVRVTVSALNLRSGPSTSETSTATLYEGDILTITDISQVPWLGVKTAAGQTGFVHSGYEGDPYVEIYVPGSASGAALSTSQLTLCQYQSARLDASVSSGLESMTWSSSDPTVAIVGYTLSYGSGHPNEQGAMVYAKKTGTAVLTFSDEAGHTKASCTVTVTAPEGVRFAYSSENTAVKGEEFYLVAITGTEKTSVTFQVVDGPVTTGSWTTSTASTETRTSTRGLPDNTVKVFKQSISFSTAGSYTLKATANGSSDSQEFEVFVKPAAESATTAATGERATSNEGLELIAAYEGSIPECYDDPVARKNPTVGFGYVVPVNTTFYNNLTQSELWGLLTQKVNSTYAPAVNRFRASYSVKMSQAQFDALVCFIYNCGSGTLSSGYGFCRAILNAANVTASASSPVTGKVNVSGSGTDSESWAPIYETADVSSTLVQKVPLNASVSITEVKNLTDKRQIWYKVTYSGKTGWMSAGYVNVSGKECDLTYADAIGVSKNIIQWCHAGTTVIEGLVWRRLSECKVFFFADYEGATPGSAQQTKNTYGFDFPDDCKGYDRR